MLAWRVFRAASAAGVIVFSLALWMGQGSAQAQSLSTGAEMWWCWDGQTLSPSSGANTDILNTTNWIYNGTVNGSYLQHPTAVNSEITGSARYGFTAEGGYGQTGTAGITNWFSGSPSVNYPSVANPSTCLVSTGENVSFTNAGAYGGPDIDGDMHLQVQGTLSIAGNLTSNGYYGIPVYAGGYNYTNYQWNNSVNVSNGGHLTVTGALAGYDQSNSGTVDGVLSLGIQDNASVNVTEAIFGHYNFNGTIHTNSFNGLGGGTLTVQGYGGSNSINTLALLPTGGTGANTGRTKMNGTTTLKVVLDTTNVASGGVVSFNTISANTLDIDGTQGPNTVPVNIQVAIAGYTAHVGDVIPVITATTLENQSGSGLASNGGVSNNITFNGQGVFQGVDWGVPFNVADGLGTDTFTAYQYNPNNPSQAGVYLQVDTAAAAPEPSTLVLLGAGALGAAVVAFRKRRAA